MNLRSTITVAIRNLATSKLRTVLAMLGILVGTASVVSMVSSGELATKQALAQFKTLGTDLLAVNFYQEGGSSSKQQNLSAKDAEHVIHANPDIKQVAPYTTLYTSVVFHGNVINAGIVGVDGAAASVIKLDMQEGRFISNLDKLSFYCVIGQNIYQQIAGEVIGSPLGKQILLGNTYFTIIGIAKHWPENSFFNQDVNNSIFIPINTSHILSQYAQINSIIMTLKKGADISAVEKDITHYINQVNPNFKLFFRSAAELIKSMEKQKQILTLFLGLIGGVSLLVGGIGVMNIMLVSVVERRREIGIRRAIGAKRRDIQLMFLAEAIVLSLLGGLLGIIIGIAISYIIAKYAAWQFAVFFMPPVVGFSVSVFIGIFFGFYPAYQASRLDPIQTLRSE